MLFVKGGFVGLPVGLAAALLRIPVVTHDSDTVPGLTNRILARYASFMAVAMPEQYYHYPKKQIRYTGLPIRSEFIKITPAEQIRVRKELGIPDDAYVVAVFGGSLGAVRLNDSVTAIAKEFLQRNPKAWLLHQTGKAQYADVAAVYESLEKGLKVRVRAWPFVDAVHEVSAVADVVVSRAGSSVYELGVQRKAVVLVPNPILTGGHQTANARILAQRKAVVVLTEQELAQSSNKLLLDTIEDLGNHPDKGKKLADALSGLAIPDAATRIVAVLEEAIR